MRGLSTDTFLDWQKLDRTHLTPFPSVNVHVLYDMNQGVMQDKIIASHTCFGGLVDVNC